MRRKHFLFLTLIVAAFCFTAPRYEARAFDPVTLAVLTPLAIQAAKVLAPHVARAASKMLKVAIRGGWELCGIFRLPLGLLQSTILAPWTFRPGLKNIGLGLIAPFKFCGWTLLLPLSPFGVGVPGAAR